MDDLWHTRVVYIFGWCCHCYCICDGNLLRCIVIYSVSNDCISFVKVKGKVVYGKEPPSGESTTTECEFNYQLLSVIPEVAQWGAPSCSQPQPATDNGVRDGRSN